MTINMQNWVDEQPLKKFRLQMTYAGPLPNVVGNVVGQDMAGTPNEVDVIGDLVGFDDNGTNAYWDYTFAPNPDWEQITFAVNPSTSIGQIDIDTVSVPEPVSIGSFLGLAVGAATRRRR